MLICLSAPSTTGRMEYKRRSHSPARSGWTPVRARAGDLTGGRVSGCSVLTSRAGLCPTETRQRGIATSLRDCRGVRWITLRHHTASVRPLLSDTLGTSYRVWPARPLPTTAAPDSTGIIQVRRVRILLQPCMSPTRAQTITLRKTPKTHTMKKVEGID